MDVNNNATRVQAVKKLLNIKQNFDVSFVAGDPSSAVATYSITQHL